VSSALASRPESEPSSKLDRPLLTSSRLLIGGCAVLLLAPLAFGAVESWAIFALETSAVVLLAAWAVRQQIASKLEVVRHPLYAPMAAFGALILVQWVSGITAYRYVTYSRLLLYSSYALLVFVITQTLKRSSQLRKLVWLLCGYGGALAFFALIQGIAPNGKLYWVFPLEQGGQIYGPYVNHNHYAGLMEMLTPFPLVLAATRHVSGNRKVAVAGVAALMAGTIFLSGSRGGMLAFTCQIAVLSLLLWPQRGRWKQHLVLGFFLAATIGLLLWIGGNELTRRLTSIHTETQQELSGGVRLTIDRDCLRMWRERPFFGWGLGTFPVVYPQFRSFYTRFFVNQAHNDYLQLLAETGLAGLAIALWFLGVTFRRAWRKLENWTETANGTLTVAALLGCIGILVHSFLDFNLQIPANAALFYVLCAIAAGEPIQETRHHRLRRHHSLILETQSDAVSS